MNEERCHDNLKEQLDDSPWLGIIARVGILKVREYLMIIKHTKYHETEVDKEGLCVYCGYYAFSRPSVQHELFPRPDYKKWNTENKSQQNWSK